MERKENLKKNIYIILSVMYTVGIIGHSVDWLYPYMIALTPFTLLFTGSLTLYAAGVYRQKSFVIWFLITYIFTFFSEYAGVQTGLIFGAYEYSSVLGFSLGDVPLIIGFNWVLVVVGSIYLASFVSKSNAARIPLAGALAVLFDFFLEPVAIGLNYWTWDDVTVPLQNYIAWFLIAACSAYLFNRFIEKRPDAIFGYYFGLQLLFFIALQILAL
ncbi:MAG: carotenoid biosynthesis protein [Ignavibacteriaceae bacterium]|nr:carotenoid biosynthesis protein [Ignavibacteriaceae bacterium]